MPDLVMAVIADLHHGHRLGLLMPGTTVWDEGPDGEKVATLLPPNALQQAIDDSLLEDLDWLANLAAGRPIYLKVNGDVTQGDKYVREWVTTRKADQITIAQSTFERVLEMPGLAGLDFIIGTDSHEFGEASASILLVRLLEPRTHIPVGLASHGLVTVNGVVFDIAHHGPPPGARRWLEGNGLRWYANDIQQRELDLGRRPPDWVIRSHYHTLAASASHYRKATKLHETQARLTPGYTGMDAYGRQATRSKYEVHIGLLAWEINENGAVKPHEKLRILDTRRKEIIR